MTRRKQHHYSKGQTKRNKRHRDRHNSLLRDIMMYCRPSEFAKEFQSTIGYVNKTKLTKEQIDIAINLVCKNILTKWEKEIHDSIFKRGFIFCPYPVESNRGFAMASKSISNSFI